MPENQKTSDRCQNRGEAFCPKLRRESVAQPASQAWVFMHPYRPDPAVTGSITFFVYVPWTILAVWGSLQMDSISEQ